ncbi:hypothetical protein BDP55DRAFT_158159 [Colletotrichum godetiae]|uniref:Uncharacterized protein n=1 Tax=Colletotrichum godetiae TaxID=1209918 RepID=A0AAJ0AKK0_9PEZI|nr:uncharacterized protein BDP55DRAFT_158159 [Colletotrichum godetiae]KAK1675603.1 hypothetical protein BDP55DRAFT_158159 [Colletotrichum godetiae]
MYTWINRYLIGSWVETPASPVGGPRWIFHRGCQSRLILYTYRDFCRDLLQSQRLRELVTPPPIRSVPIHTDITMSKPSQSNFPVVHLMQGQSLADKEYPVGKLTYLMQSSPVSRSCYIYVYFRPKPATIVTKHEETTSVARPTKRPIQTLHGNGGDRWSHAYLVNHHLLTFLLLSAIILLSHSLLTSTPIPLAVKIVVDIR